MSSTTVQRRRYDIDWLRIIAMLSIYLYHCARFFDTEGWELKNAEQSGLLFVLMRGLIWPWVMELFFLLSGTGTWYVLESKSPGAYLWERVKRLLIPLYTVGLVLLLPVQYYFRLTTDGESSGTFRDVVFQYFARFKPPSLSAWPDTLLPVPYSGHLWFLQYLFLISLVSLPLLLFFKSKNGRIWISKLAGGCERRGGIFLFLIPLCLVRIGLQALEVGRGWPHFVWYAAFFIVGFLMGSGNGFAIGVRRHGLTCLALWILGFCTMGLVIFRLGFNPSPGAESYSLTYVLYHLAYSVASWGSVVFVLSLGARYLTANTRALVYGNEAVLPFYLLHQTVILCVGWYVIRWDMGILSKLLIIVFICLPLIMLLYEMFINRFGVIRFFFGMRPKRALSTIPSPHPVQSSP